MHSQTVRLFVYSSLAIVALTLVWGLRQIPKQGALAEDQLRTSLEQELSVLSSAVKSSTAALKYRLLDVLKAEGNDHPTRAFQESPFQSAALLEWDGVEWKVMWHSSKQKDEFQIPALKTWMQDWPLAKLNGDEAYFAKVADVAGQPYFALVVKVAKPNNIPMLGIGVFPAAQYGLNFTADQAREVRVFDDKGFALALAHPAYVGASLKREPIVAEILDGESLSLRQEWKSERGIPMLGLAQRLNDSNLFAAVETKLPLGRQWYLQAWLYLLLSAAGAVALNWMLFSSLIKPLLEQLAQTEEFAEKLRRQLAGVPAVPMAPAVFPTPGHSETIPTAELPNMAFLENAAPAVAVPVAPESVTLAKVVGSALSGLDARVRDLHISVNRIGLENVAVDSDIPQLRTAIEEVLKNAIEAMQDSENRQLTISGRTDRRRVYLTIEDTGAGIAPENLKKVFDPFFSTKDSQGVARGLGLNVVRRVVEELHGTVEVRNRGGAPGAIAEIQWPIEAPPESELQFTVDEDAIAAKPAAVSAWPVSSDLEFLADETGDEFATLPVRREWPDVPIRKPKVRSLD